MLRATRPTVQARIHENACPNGVAYASTKNKHFIVHDRSSWVYEWCMELNFKKKKKKEGKAHYPANEYGDFSRGYTGS